jgi:effector-binding domain-containing protein
MLKIGDFSRLARVSVKALRYYDELGLLKPVKVDEFTGYRYYSATQLTQLYRIVALKDMGLSLEEIARLIKDDVSIAHILDLLHTKQEEQKKKLEVETERLKRVEEWLMQVEKEGKMPNYEIVIKKIAPLKVVSIRQIMPNYSATGQLFERIAAYVYKSGSQMTGPPMLIIHDDGFKEKDVDLEAAFPIAREVLSKSEFKCLELPDYEQAATTIHKGSYDSVGGAYSALGKWIETNGYQITGPCREIYYTDPRGGTPPNEYITEIQFPVVKI